jgi:hypothetical protein
MMENKDGTDIWLSRQNATSNSTANFLEFNLCQPVYQAVILHPSLGCPLIVDDNKKDAISLFLVAGEDFKKTFDKGAVDKIGGNSIKFVIDELLNIVPWDKEGKVQKHPGKSGLLYPDPQTAFDKIVCTDLGQLDMQLKDAAGHHFANIRGATQKVMQGKGLKYLYQVMLEDLPVIRSSMLFEAFWTVRNENPVAGDYSEKLLNLSDRLVREMVRNSFWKHKDEEKPLKPGPDKAYRIKEEVVKIVNEEGEVEEVYGNTVDFTAFDDKVPLMMRHPIFVSAKQSLNIAHIGDLHISSRQHAYKKRSANVIPGEDAASGPIGEMVGNNLEHSLELMDRIGNDSNIDLLVVAGDLYDHLHNFDPSSGPVTSTGRLWEAMHVSSTDDIRERIEEYPYGIDALAFYSMLLHYYNSYQKPVLMISGNHEAYEYPYGISPRVKVNDSEIMKVNDGIPLDHNLTFYEAILLYGPGYANILQKSNFNSSNFDWFSTAFSPLADYVISYGDQCLVCLEWGDDESYLASYVFGGGTLPRAGEGGSSQQIALGNSALNRPQTNKILCTHYTLVNYEPKLALSELGKVFPTDTYTLYDYGSAWGKRQTLYGHWLRQGSFNYALAGHAHRAGLYTCDYRPAIQIGQEEDDDFLKPAYLQTRGGLPDKADLAILGDRTKMLVSASAGCIAKQNLAGELNGRGMDCPAATLLYFDGEGERIEILPSKRQTAKPRFCVACDYIDIMDGGFWESFKAVGDGGTFEMKPYWGKIHPKLSDDVKGKLIESVTLYLVGGGNFLPCIAKPVLRNNDSLGLDLGKQIRRSMEEDYTIDVFFISIKFNGDAVKWIDGFSQYNYDSPWNIQVGIYSERHDLFENPKDSLLPGFTEKKKALLERRRANMSSWEIRRHKVGKCMVQPSRMPILLKPISAMLM